jgi:hypothetical protein
VPPEVKRSLAAYELALLTVSHLVLNEEPSAGV